MALDYSKYDVIWVRKSSYYTSKTLNGKPSSTFKYSYILISQRYDYQFGTRDREYAVIDFTKNKFDLSNIQSIKLSIPYTFPNDVTSASSLDKHIKVHLSYIDKYVAYDDIQDGDNTVPGAYPSWGADIISKTYTGKKNQGIAINIDIPETAMNKIRTDKCFIIWAYIYSDGDGTTKEMDLSLSGVNIEFEEYPLATISNLLQNGDYWERDVNISWQSTYQERFEIELWQNNIKIGNTITGESLKSYTIKSNTFTSKDNAIVKVRVCNKGGKWSNWQEVSLRLKDIEATISNLLIEGEYWESPIKVSWQSTNQQQFRIEVLKSNQVVKTYTGTTATSYTIPAEQLESGAYTFRVTVAYANRYVNSTERTVTLKDIQASVSNPVLSGSNIDLDLIFSWTSADQQKYEVEIYKDSDRVKNYSGTTATSVAIPHSSLTTGLHKFRVRVAFKDRWSDWKEFTATLTETLPSIGAFEPDGVITERDNPTRVWWTSQNQSKWKLVIDESTTYTGTSEKEKILTPGALQTGKHSMVLTVTYVTAAGVEKHVTKKAEWIVQGKPPIPTITSSSTFNTNRPTIVWDTQDQQGYILDILKDGIIIYTTDWQNGLVTEHKIMDYLSNGTYTARVKIMNQFSLESDSGSKDFTINSNIDTSINLIAEAKGNCVELTWNNTGGMFEKCYIIRNGEVVASTILETYVDYTAWGDCAYTIRGVTSQDVYKDSNVVAVQCNISLGIMATVGALNDVIQVGISRNEFNFNGSIDLSNTQVVLNGRELPVVVFGEHSNNTYNISFVSKELFHFIEMCKRRQIFLYRDKRQKLYLSITNPSYTIDRLGIEYTIQATEVDYNEVITYD